MIFAESFSSVMGRASPCSSQICLQLRHGFIDTGTESLPGVNVAGRCRIPWITPMLS